jgi:hypothetical protein
MVAVVVPCSNPCSSHSSATFSTNACCTPPTGG